MLTEATGRRQTSHRRTTARQLVVFFIGLVFAATLFPLKLHAQIVGAIEANIPFAFHAGNTKLPPGRYVVHVLDDSNLSIMEISSEDGSVSALFEVVDAEANSSPAKSELVFNKYGNRYFLAKLFDEGNARGSQVLKSRYEERLRQESVTGQEHVPARHRRQQGN